MDIGDPITIAFDTSCDEGRRESGRAVTIDGDSVRVGTRRTRPDFELDQASGDVAMICVPNFPDMRIEQFGENGSIVEEAQ